MPRSIPSTILRSLAVTSLALLTTVACASTPTVQLEASPAEIYGGMTRDQDLHDGSGSVFGEDGGRQKERFAEMMRRAEAGELKTAEDHFYAGAILVRSSDLEQLLIAESLGRRATLLGDPRGRPVAGEAVDRQAFQNGRPQKYGTQYAYSHLTGNWLIYLLDPTTTDEERAATGLPDLAWFEDRVRQLNESERSSRLRRDLDLPPND